MFLIFHFFTQNQFKYISVADPSNQNSNYKNVWAGFPSICGIDNNFHSKVLHTLMNDYHMVTPLLLNRRSQVQFMAKEIKVVHFSVISRDRLIVCTIIAAALSLVAALSV